MTRPDRAGGRGGRAREPRGGRRTGRGADPRPARRRARALAARRPGARRTRSTRCATLVVAGGKRLRPAFCHWAFVGAGGDPDDADRGRRRRRARAAPQLRPRARRHHGRLRPAPGRARGAPGVHRAARGGRVAGPVPPVRRGRGDPRRRLRVRLRRRAHGRRLARGPRASSTSCASSSASASTSTSARPRPAGATRRQARTIEWYKSGKYTVERPLHLGAALAGRLDELQAPLSAFGLPLGEAFQMRDDLLGVFGTRGRHRQARRRRPARGQAHAAARRRVGPGRRRRPGAARPGRRRRPRPPTRSPRSATCSSRRARSRRSRRASSALVDESLAALETRCRSPTTPRPRWPSSAASSPGATAEPTAPFRRREAAIDANPVRTGRRPAPPIG